MDSERASERADEGLIRGLTEIDILDITTGTEEIEQEEGGTANVSSITIKLGEGE